MEPMYHIGLDDSHGAKYAILPGDPGRVEKIAGKLENPRFLHQNREYTTWIGTLSGEPVLVMSTGMGGPSTAIGVEELYRTGVHTMIRIGTCGGMAKQVVGGDLVIANGAIRMEGTSREYVDLAFPAVADFQVTKALEQAADELGATAHLGIVQCKDSFYGQHDPGRMPCGRELEEVDQSRMSCLRNGKCGTLYCCPGSGSPGRLCTECDLESGTEESRTYRSSLS